MAESVLFGIAQELLKNLGSAALDEIASAWGFKARIEKLKNTVNTVKDVLLDAEEKQVDSHAVHGWLERLHTVVYAADDLFDELATVASRKQFVGESNWSNEVVTFFSGSNQILFALKISQRIKKVKNELDEIVKDNIEFALVNRIDEGRLINRKKDDSYSFVDVDEIIGRDEDKKVVLDLLFTHYNHEHGHEHEVLPVIPIVGIGGQGKTTLAQLIYNDDQVVENFDLRLWVCVSDVFDIKGIIEKLLKSVEDIETRKLEIEHLQIQLRREIGDKKYFLVLDDVWNEDREEWIKLRSLLKMGGRGSVVLVTTRSMEVARIMGTLPPYQLHGLSEEKSWELFEKMAFEPGQAQREPHLVKVGKDIVRKCACVPLAIRALGSLIHGKDESKWLSIKDTSLLNIPENPNGIISILKFSYHHLWSPLKNCFAYCALFPKDANLKKETLIELWMAEGFIVPANGSQSLEELAEEYFLILLQRCFFQDVTRNEWGAIVSCKMHDLMHDLAQQVAGAKCKVTKLGERHFNSKVYHLSFTYRLDSLWKIPDGMLDLKLLRTFLLPEQRDDGSTFSKTTCQKLISRFRCLRVLDLHSIGVKCLPSSIGKLIHLRYLNLSVAPIKVLPGSITKLHNLQTLKLYLCLKLRVLPKNIQRLVNLRSLDVGECHNLTYMPSGLKQLTSLSKLPLLIVGDRRSPTFSSKSSANLSDLENLNNLRGALHIELYGSKDLIVEATKANLSSKHELTELHIDLTGLYLYEALTNHDEAVMEALRPYHKLRKLRIDGYRGQKLPSWVMKDNLYVNLPNLVEIKLYKCEGFQQAPNFGKLPLLKRLMLEYLSGVEYMESDVYDLSFSSSINALFFPSLQELRLMHMNNLKGWCKVVAGVNNGTEEASCLSGKQHLSSLSFPKLSKLWIERCPNLVFLPLCPNVEELTLVDTNKTLSVLKAATSSHMYSSKLKHLSIGDTEELISMPKECLHQLSFLEVKDSNLVRTSRLVEVFQSLSSLRSLAFSDCHNLISFSEGVQFLTALEKLDLLNCRELDLLPNESPEDVDGMPWKAFKNLQYLQLREIPKLWTFPKGFQHLVNLRSLEIRFNKNLKEIPESINCFQSLEYMELFDCPSLTSLPEGIGKLTSLTELRIIECPGLTERCRGPDGNDWPKIQHIPHVSIRASIFD
ncbi:unnamed protein product [Amaranthus hypochondriacus]